VKSPLGEWPDSTKTRIAAEAAMDTMSIAYASPTSMAVYAKQRQPCIRLVVEELPLFLFKCFFRSVAERS
jgi:hypothetical protein